MGEVGILTRSDRVELIRGVDCVAESIEIHCTPHADGYRDVTRVTGPAATVALQAFPDVALRLSEIFA